MTGPIWMYLDTDAQVEWPTGVLSSPTASSTTTASAAMGGRMSAGGTTTIESIQLGPENDVGILSIYAYDGTTLIREIALPNASTTNQSINVAVLPFSFPGGFSAAHDTSGTVVDVYIQFTYQESAV